MLKFNWLILFALFVGAFVPLQTSLNSMLGGYMKTPLLATLVNFLVGLITISIIILVLFRDKIPNMAELARVPWYAFTAGMLGVLFVSTVVVLTPKIGVTNMLAGAMAGQLIMSVVFDHFGWFNMPHIPISPWRIAGVLFLIIGIILTQK